MLKKSIFFYSFIRFLKITCGEIGKKDGQGRVRDR
jgi:hypothetical protein